MGDIKRAKAKGSLRDINYYCYNEKPKKFLRIFNIRIYF